MESTLESRQAQLLPAVQKFMIVHAVEATTGPAASLRFRGRLRPEGLLSQTFRVGLLVLSASLLILAVSAYLLALV